MTAVLTDEERGQLALLVMDIFEQWRLDSDQQRNLLGLPQRGGARTLTQFKRGNPLPQEEAILNRAKHVLGIQESLRLVFPHNAHMPRFWLNNRNRQLRDKPLMIMLEGGLEGMYRVWRSIDCTVNWTE